MVAHTPLHPAPGRQPELPPPCTCPGPCRAPPTRRPSAATWCTRQRAWRSSASPSGSARCPSCSRARRATCATCRGASWWRARWAWRGRGGRLAARLVRHMLAFAERQSKSARRRQPWWGAGLAVAAPGCLSWSMLPRPAGGEQRVWRHLHLQRHRAHHPHAGAGGGIRPHQGASQWLGCYMWVPLGCPALMPPALACRCLWQNRRHYIMALRRGAYHKRGPAFTEMATLIR